MKKRISIADLASGMFVEAHVHSERAGAQMRHFLVPEKALYEKSTNKRARLTRLKHKQVAHSGGLLLSSESHVTALRSTGLSAVTINTDKGADVSPEAVAVDLTVEDGSVDAARYTEMLLGGEPDEDPAPPDTDEEDCFLDLISEPESADTSDPEAPRRAFTPPETRDGRLHFGPSKRAWMRVEVDEDGQQAVLRVLSFGGDDTLGVEDVLQALQDAYGLKAGFDRTLIRQLTAQAVASPKSVTRGEFGIARVADPPAVTDVRYPFLDGLGRGVRLPYGALKTALTLDSLEEVLAQSPLARMVQPGDEIAVIESAQDESRSLLDIFGRRREDDGLPLAAGDDVRVVGNAYVSEIFGYVCLLDGVSVLSPIWVSPDEVEAHFIDFRQAGTVTTPEREWVEELIRRAGVTEGVVEDAFIELARTRQGDDPRAVLVARGTPPTPGQDAHIDFSFDHRLWPGAFQDDGSVDFHERNAYTRVESGQLLGTILPATRGRPGRNLRGEPIPVGDGRHDSFSNNDNVRVDGRPQQLFSRVAGSVRVRGNAVNVHEVIQIHGDVDYALGNIDAGKDVYVTGSVKPGFSVRLQGDLMVGGTIEGGATINASGDVVVSQGIVGGDTRVVSLGSVHAKFVQNSSIMARGDIVVGSYLLNADVRAGGRLIVRQGKDGRGGTIVGGQALAGERIDAWRVGSASTDKTTVGIIPSPDTEARVHKAVKAIEYCDRFIVRAFRTLGLETIDAAQLRVLIERTPREEREPIMTVLRQLKKVTATRAHSLHKRAELEKETEDSIAGGEIHVLHTAFADVEVRLGNRRLVLDQDLHKPVFCLTGGDVTAR